MVKIKLTSETVKLGLDMYDAVEFARESNCPHAHADYICDMPHKHCGDCD